MENEMIISEMIDLYNTYDYHPTQFGVGKQVETWRAKKAGLIELFKVNKDYNGRYQIVFKQSLPRQIEESPVREFFSIWRDWSIEKVREFGGEDWWFYSGSAKENQLLWGWVFKDAKQIEIFKAIDWITSLWQYAREIDAQSAEALNNFCPSLRVHSGQKATRVIGKMCKASGFDQIPDYNRLYATLTDALSPGRFKATIVISCHPVDYLTSAFGNSWTTCATLDKKNKRGYTGDHIYRGLSSGGNGSYMEDGTTFVFYILKGDYNGNTPELEPKIYRNLFHFNGNTLIQGRVYPKSKDGATNLYKEFREIVMETLFPEAKWTTEIGYEYCSETTITRGCHFADYLQFDDCNVSYMEGKEHSKVVIGAKHHCPSCGYLTNHKENIECEDCANKEEE